MSEKINTNMKKQLENIEEEKKELLVLAIELGNKNKKYLKIYEDSIPEQIAYDFCSQNNLDFDSLQNLINEIKNVMANSTVKNSVEESNEKNKENNILNNVELEKPKYNFKDMTNEVGIENKPNKINQNSKGNHLYQNFNQNQRIQNNNSSSKKNETSKSNNIHEKSDKQHSYLAQTKSSQSKIRKGSNEIKDFDINYDKNNDVNDDNITSTNNNFNKSTYKNYTMNDNEYLNFGERLYRKELKLKEKAMQRTKLKVAEDNKEKESNYTFMPQINNLNMYDLQYRNLNKLAYNDEDRINFYQDYVQARVEKTKNKFMLENEKENTFAPKINKNSILIDQYSKNNCKIPRYEQLYNKKLDIKELEERIYDKNVLFKPNLNKNYRSVYNNMPFDERQKIYRAKSSEKINRINNQINSCYDVKTGQKLFQPSINNYKSNRKQRSNLVYDELYSDAEKNKLKKEEISQQLLNEQKIDFEFKANNKSDEFYVNQKLNSFKKIFNILDKNQNGKISQFNLNYKELPKNIQKVLTPIIEELNEENETLNLDEFITACNHLYNMIDYIDKREIYNFALPPRSKSINSDSGRRFSFKPKINAKSNMINNKYFNNNNVNNNNNYVTNKTGSYAYGNDQENEAINEQDLLDNDNECISKERLELKDLNTEHKKKINEKKEYNNLVIQKDEDQIIDKIEDFKNKNENFEIYENNKIDNESYNISSKKTFPIENDTNIAHTDISDCKNKKIKSKKYGNNLLIQKIRDNYEQQL